MVFVMVAVTAVFFLVADQIMRFVVAFVLNIHDWRTSLNDLNPIVVLAVGAGLGLIGYFTWSHNRNRGR